MDTNFKSENLDDIYDGEIELDMTLGITSRKEYYYKIIKIDTLEYIGTCNICLEKNEKNEFLGNVGYEIFPKYQGNNYAYKATRLLSKVAEYYGVDKLLITANPKNLASIKTINKLGAHFINVRNIPANHCLYKQGERYVYAYEWNLKKEGEENDRYKIN